MLAKHNHNFRFQHVKERYFKQQVCISGRKLQRIFLYYVPGLRLKGEEGTDRTAKPFTLRTNYYSYYTLFIISIIHSY